MSIFRSYPYDTQSDILLDIHDIILPCSELHFPAIWGTWGPREVCPGRFDFATAYRIKDEGYQGGFSDDTAMNGIELRCKDGQTLTSSVGIWGSWGSYSTSCSTGLTGANVKIEGDQVGREKAFKFCL